MTPEFPVAIPAKFIDTRIAEPRLECSMLRSEVRCNNETGTVAMFPGENGTYITIAICDMCIGDYFKAEDRRIREDIEAVNK